MSSQKLRMTYHPAKKEIKFERFGADGSSVPIRSDSKLRQYMDQKGEFILQHHGDKLFEDIAGAFDGEVSVNMEVITTKSDYGDFEQMVEYYNEGHNVKINATLLAELPDMNTTYVKVKEHGENAIAIINKHRADFQTIQTDTPAVRSVINDFSQAINEAAKRIREKIDSMGDNNINLCFAGVYSTGKSTLINAILGYKILPEAIKSETARMFKIKSPQKGEFVRIHFTIDGEYAELLWNEEKKIFEFFAGPTENEVREGIQTTINECSSKEQHEQILGILKKLNESTEIGSPITIYFPIPLDTQNIQFTIYDTPGADSNYREHQVTLQDALAEQTHSILVFVAAPNKLEGAGNNALLSYLREAEEKGSKTSIDIGRSLFVINLIDSVYEPEQREVLQKAKITHKKEKKQETEEIVGSSAPEDSDFTIDLANKKLFFTSAMFGYAAKAQQNHISSQREDSLIKRRFEEVTSEEDGRYYRLDHVATSECATKRLLSYCDETLEKALEEHDNLTAISVGSGVYALEREILTYGEKYAGAVKAFAIIDSVDKALSMMSTTARSLEKQNQEDIDAVNCEIEKLSNVLTQSISEVTQNHEIKKGEIPDSIMKSLKLDSDSITERIHVPAMSFIEKLLKGWFFGLGKVKARESHIEKIKYKINTTLSDYSKEFLRNRQTVLETERDEFIKEIQKKIQENGDLSEEGKRYICQINPPEVQHVTDLAAFGDVYNSYKRTQNILFWKNTTVDKDGFKIEVAQELANITAKMTVDFKKDYEAALKSIHRTVEEEFTNNKDKYSVLLKAKIEDKKAMEELRAKIALTESALLSCQETLNSTIWSVNVND